MKNRTQKAAQDYQKKNWKGTEAAFYPTDATDIIKNSGGGTGRSNNGAGSGLYDRLQEGAAGLQEAPEDSLTEAQAAIMCFELWQDMIINRTAPDPRRYKAEVLDFYKGVLAGTHAPFYFMFMGFIGGLDFANQTDKAQEGAAE